MGIDPLLLREGIARNGWQPTADALLTMELRTQSVAARGNGFGLFSARPRSGDLLPIAIVATTGFH